MKNKFKIIALILVILFVAVIAYGCGKNNSETGISDFITTMTASASSVSENINFDFEVVYYDDENGLSIYHETTTDTLFAEFNGYNAGGLTQIMDPETGKPLTYTLWKEKYAK